MVHPWTKEVTSFLSKGTKAYAAGDIEEKEVTGNSFVGEFEEEPCRLVDMYTASPDQRIYNGREILFHDSEPIWAASYHGVVDKTADPDEVLTVHTKALKKPAKELPIRGPRSIRINGVEYRLDSLKGPLSIARFVVTEYMIQDGIQIYDGHIIGGWLTSEA